MLVSEDKHFSLCLCSNLTQSCRTTPTQMCPYNLPKVLLSPEKGQLRCQGTFMLEGASNYYHLFL